MEVLFVLGWVALVLVIKMLKGETDYPDNSAPTTRSNPYQNPDRVPVNSPELDYWLQTYISLPGDLQIQAKSSLTPQEEADLNVILRDFSQSQVEWRHLTPASLAATEKVRLWLQTRSLEAHLVLFNALGQDRQLDVLASLGKDGVVFSVLNNQYLDSGSFSEPPGLLNQWDFTRNLHQALLMFSDLTPGENPGSIDLGKIEAAMSLTHFTIYFPILSQEQRLDLHPLSS